MSEDKLTDAHLENIAASESIPLSAQLARELLERRRDAEQVEKLTAENRSLRDGRELYRRQCEAGREAGRVDGQAIRDACDRHHTEQLEVLRGIRDALLSFREGSAGQIIE